MPAEEAIAPDLRPATQEHGLIDLQGKPLFSARPAQETQATQTTDTDDTLAADTTAEDEQNPEKVSAKRQSVEIQHITGNIVARKARELSREGAPHDPGSKALRDVQRLSEAATGSYTLPCAETGNPIIVTVNGEKKQLLTITGSSDRETFTCTVDDVDGAVTLPRSEVIQGQLVAEINTLLSSPALSTEEKLVLKNYAAFKEKGVAGLPPTDSAESETLNAAIKKSAEQAGMLTAGDVEGFITAFVNDLEEDQRSTETQDAALATLQGKNLADPASLIDVVKTLGHDLSDEQAAVIHEFFERSDTGSIDVVKAKSAAMAFRMGDIDGIIALAHENLAPTPGDSPAVTEQKAKGRATRLEQYKKAGAVGGGLLLATLLLALSVSSSLSR